MEDFNIFIVNNIGWKMDLMIICMIAGGIGGALGSYMALRRKRKKRKK